MIRFFQSDKFFFTNDELSDHENTNSKGRRMRRQCLIGHDRLAYVFEEFLVPSFPERLRKYGHVRHRIEFVS